MIFPQSTRLMIAVSWLVCFSPSLLAQENSFSPHPVDMKRLSANELLKRVTTQVAPNFPPSAMAASIRYTAGKLVVEVTVNKDGDVVATRSISGVSLLQGAAIEAAKAWKFTPFHQEAFSHIVGPIVFEEPPEVYGRSPHGVEYYLEEVKSEPESWIAHCKLAKVFSEKTLYQKSVNEYQKAITLSSLDPNKAIAFYGLGEVYSRQKLFDLALVAYQEAIRLNPTFIEANIGVAWMYSALQKRDKAIEVFQQIAASTSDLHIKDVVWTNILSELIKDGKSEKHLIEATEQRLNARLEKRSIDLNLDSTFGAASDYLELAKLYTQAGQYQTAIETYQKVIELDPNSDFAFQASLNAANLFKQVGKELDAQQIYQDWLKRIDAVLTTNPSKEKKAMSYYGQGIILEQMGKEKDAIKAHQKAVRIDPDLFDSHEALYNLYLKTGDRKSAQREYKTMKKLEEE